MKILAMLLLGANVFALTPVRPTFQDVSLKVIEPSPGNAYQWYQGRIATQVERDAMESLLYGVAMEQSLKFARSIPACQSAYSLGLSNFNKISAKLGGGYEDNSLLSGIWTLNTYGRHYSFEFYSIRAIRNCVVSGSAAIACANSSLLTPDLQNLLNIKVLGGVCVKGNDSFQVMQPVEPYSSIIGMEYPVQVKSPQVPLNANQLALLHATHMAHSAISQWRCNGGVKPNVSVDQAHQDFEASANDKGQQHFFTMRKFSGDVDPLLPANKVCAWATLQDKFHMLWMNAIEGFDRKSAWRESRRRENDHLLAHFCMNFSDPNFKVQFSCDNKSRILDCPVMTCDQFLTSQGL